MDSVKKLWLDLETGGIDPSESSILSIALGQEGNIKSLYNRPIPGSFLSDFSKQNIIPQLQQNRLNLITEKESIQNLINTLSQQKGAPLHGYNLNFDIGFLQQRSRIYGLENSYLEAIKSRKIVDEAQLVKSVIATSISQQADLGTFSTLLENKTWKEAEQTWENLHFSKRPEAYNVIKQVKGYLEARGPDPKFKGWKLEDVYSLLGETPTGAHQAAIDLQMTARVAQAAESGELGKVLASPSGATRWLQNTINRGYHRYSKGQTLTRQAIGEMGLSPPLLTKGRLKMAGAAAAALAGLYLFSGKDDDYNTIEGLRHGGLAQSGRMELTEFGSGYRGIIGVSEFVANLIGRPLAFQGSVRDLQKHAKAFRKYRIASRGSTDPKDIAAASYMKRDLPFRQEYANYLKELRRAKKAGHEEIVGIQRDVDWKSLGMDLKTVVYHERLHQKIAESGLRQAYLTGGSDLKFLDPSVALDKSVEMYPEPIKAEERLVRILEYIRSPKQYKKAINISPTVRDVVPTQSEIESTLGVVKKWEIPISKKYMGKFSGKDDAYNTLEGLGHKGIGWQIRQLLTPFGSGWDALRNFLKQGEKFEDLLGSSEFKEALSNAAHVKVLGKGGMGEANLMKSSFRGQEFEFVRKQGQIGISETRTMRQFQDEFAPSVYSEGNLSDNTPFIDMEYIKGKTFSELGREGKLGISAVDEYEQAIRRMNSMDIVHGDAHASNVILTPEGRVGIIDYGGAGLKGDIFGSETAEGIFEHSFKPGGFVGEVLNKKKLGYSTRVKVETLPEGAIGPRRQDETVFGWFTKREQVLDETAIEVLRWQHSLQKPSISQGTQALTETMTGQLLKTETQALVSPRAQGTNTAVGRKRNKKREMSDLNRAVAAESWSNATVAGRKSKR